LEAHLWGVAQIAAVNARKLKPMGADGAPCPSFEAVGELLGLLHDLGKYSKEFQDYIGSAVGLIDQDADDFVDPERLRGRIDHSTAGAAFIWRNLAKEGPFGPLVGQILAICLASHHSGLIDCLTPNGEDNFTRRMSKAEQRAHCDEVLAKIDTSVSERIAFLTHDSRLTDSLQCLTRCIVENEHRRERSEPIVQFKFGLTVRFLFSCLIDADRLDTADFERPHGRRLRNLGEYVPWDVLLNRLEAHLDGLAVANPIDRLRRDISGHCKQAAYRAKGLFSLSVPTGGGKTLASLRFALHHARKHGLDRIVYVIPFTSIIDQNADVVRRILEPDGEDIEPGSIVLEHHSNLTPDKQTWRAKILSENWDTQVIYTTTVQLLETLFGAGTRDARRMHQLANAVIVFDEVQTVPLCCIHLFNNMVNFLVEQCGSSVLFCTATQPLLNAVNPTKGAARLQPGNEIIPNVQGLFDALSRTKILLQRKAGGWGDKDIAALAVEEIASSGSCLVIVNTKAAAQNLYKLCKLVVKVPIFHLSTSMCPTHRKRILRVIRHRLVRSKPTLCISTQLIEAGVDVDFGAVIRHVAGLDSIAQAAGRCNRNGRKGVGRVHVINPTEDKIDRLIDIRIGRDVAMRVMSEYEFDPTVFDNSLLGPKAIGKYFEYYFFQRAAEMDYPVSSDAATRNDTLLNLLSENCMAVNDYKQQHNSAPAIHLRQAFMTAAQAFRAIDAPTRGVIVPYGREGRDLVAQLCGEFKPALQFGLLRRAQQFTVNVFPYIFDALQRTDAISEIGAETGIYHLRPEYYSKEFGLSETPVTPMEAYSGSRIPDSGLSCGL
jgi:CRISPR-associated endonuclease/helicase Cas3